MDGRGPEEGSITPAGALSSGASIDSASSSPRNPPPADLAVEARFGGWPSLQDWDDYFTREEEKLEQKNRQLEEECRADWAKLEEDFDRKRRFEKHLEERWSKLEVEAAQLAEEKRQIEKKMEEDRARLDQLSAEQDRRLEAVIRKERDLHIREEALNKFFAIQKEQLQKPLLVHPDHINNKEEQMQKHPLLQSEDKHYKNDGNWNLSCVVSVIAFASGLLLFSQVQRLFSLDYPKFIVDAFAILWALGSVVLSFKISRGFSGKNTFNHYIAPFASFWFNFLGLCALYLFLRWVDGTFSGASPSSSSSVPVAGLGSNGRDADFIT